MIAPRVSGNAPGTFTVGPRGSVTVRLAADAHANQYQYHNFGITRWHRSGMSSNARTRFDRRGPVVKAFRRMTEELAGKYLRWLEEIKSAKPSTLRDHCLLLADPGTVYRRGAGVSRGVLMAALGDRPAREVTTREIEDLLRSVASTGVAPRTVNKVRQLVCAIFNYGMRPSTYGLPLNPATYADRRAEPERAVVAFFSPEQIEVLARSRCWLISRSVPAGIERRRDRGAGA
jgi:hypothetical protein